MPSLLRICTEGPQIGNRQRWLGYWGNRYIITGMSGNGRRVYRVTLRPADEAADVASPTTPADETIGADVVFRLSDDDTLTIPGAHVHVVGDTVGNSLGFWVLQDVAAGFPDLLGYLYGLPSAAA